MTGRHKTATKNEAWETSTRPERAPRSEIWLRRGAPKCVRVRILQIYCRIISNLSARRCLRRTIWPKKCVLGCVSSPLRPFAMSGNLEQTFKAISVLVRNQNARNFRGSVDRTKGWTDRVIKIAPSSHPFFAFETIKRLTLASPFKAKCKCSFRAMLRTPSLLGGRGTS